MSRAQRRVRCKGPLCLKKRDEAQLHFRSETVEFKGSRYCLDCVDEFARLRKAAEDARYEQGEMVAVAGVEDPPVYGQEDAADGGQVAPLPLEPVLPAPTIQVDLGDPLTYTRFPDVEVPGWPLRRGRLSASSIGTFVTCPEKFRQREVLGMREPGSGNTIAGGAAHKGIEAYFRYVMMQGEPPPYAVWHEWLHAKFDHELNREDGVIDWGKQAFGDKHPLTSDEVRARAVQVAGTYLDRVAPHVNPVAVEDRFVVWVEGCPVPVVGSRDIVEAETTIDVKFGQAKAQLDPGWRIQGLIYLLSDERDMAWHSVGWPKVDGTCTFHTPLDAPALRMPRTYQNYTIASDLIRSSVKSILAYAQVFGTDNPWPGNLSHQWACDLCDFRKTEQCSWWTRRVNAEDLL